MGRLRLDLRPHRRLDLLAWFDTPYPMAQVTGRDRRPVGQAWQHAPGRPAERPAEAEDTELLLRHDDLRRARHPAGGHFPEGATVFLPWLRAVPPVHAPRSAFGKTRRDRANRRSAASVAGSLRKQILQQASVALEKTKPRRKNRRGFRVERPRASDAPRLKRLP